MRTTIHPIASLLSALALLLIAGPLHAQRWQYEYGGSTSLDIGTRGVTPVSSGGYVAAGSAHGTSSVRDIYVVRTNDDGSLAWSYTYNIENGHSGATCIRECANGDFIVLGSTQLQASCCCNPRNVILMRLKPDGSVIWVKSYGSPLAETGESVIETRFGNGEETSPGDFMVCGSATNSDGTTRAYMFRTTAGGKLIWDKTYALFYIYSFNPQTLMRRYARHTLNDLHESNTGSLLTDSTIWTTGTVQTTATGPSQGMLVRINGNNGDMSADPLTWNLNRSSTVATSVKELSRNGCVVVTGSVDYNGSPNTFISRFRPGGCGPLVTRHYLRGQLSYGIDIQEKAVDGHVIVAGTATASTGLGSSDAMLIEVDSVNLGYTGAAMTVYGQQGADGGSSVKDVPQSMSRTAGFIITGQTASSGGAQLYLIKTNDTGDSRCNWRRIDDSPSTPVTYDTCHTFDTSSIRMMCQPVWTADPRTWETELCYSSTRAAGGEGPSGGELSGVAPLDPSTDMVVPISDEASVAGYPNPVRKGSSFKLEYALADPGPIAIDVVDIAGRTVYSRSGDYPAGSSQIPVSTEGWAAGTYILKLTREGATATRRITVIDR